MQEVNLHAELLDNIVKTRGEILNKLKGINDNAESMSDIVDSELRKNEARKLCEVLSLQLEKYKEYLYTVATSFEEMRLAFAGDEKAERKVKLVLQEIDEIIVTLIYEKYELMKKCDVQNLTSDEVVKKEIDIHKDMLNKITTYNDGVILNEEEKVIYKQDVNKKQFISKEIKNIKDSYERVTMRRSIAKESANVFKKFLKKFKK